MRTPSRSGLVGAFVVTVGLVLAPTAASAAPAASQPPNPHCDQANDPVEYAKDLWAELTGNSCPV